MLQALLNTFRIPELRNKVLFTLSMLVIYRIGFWIPLVGVDQTELAESAKSVFAFRFPRSEGGPRRDVDRTRTG